MKTKILQKGKQMRKILMFAVCVTSIIWMDKVSILTVHAEGTAKVITESAKVRTEANTSSEQVGSLKNGETINVLEETKDASGTTWYQVEVDGKKGYIRSDLVQKDGGASTTNTTGVSTSDKKEGTVLKDSVRVRKDANTSADVVATLGKGVELKIAGEKKGADGKTWYSVSFTYQNKTVDGFVRSDFITFDALPEEEPEVSEIEGSAGGDASEESTETQEPMTETAENTEAQKEQPQNSQAVEYQLLNVEEIPEVPQGYTEVQLSWNDENIRSWKNGAYYIFYARNSEGNEGWYRFDSEEGTYQRYDPATEAAKGGNMVQTIIIIALAVVVVILIVVITILFIKLNDYKQDDWEDDDEEDEDEEDDNLKREKAKKKWRSLNFLSSEEDEDEEDDDEDEDYEDYEDYEEDDDEDVDEYIPVRSIKRPAPQGSRPVQGQAPARRLAPQEQAPVRRPMPQEQAPARRPAPQGQAPARRPAPQGQAPARRLAPQGQAPVRRPVPPQDAPARRPAPQGQAPVRRPVPPQDAPMRRPEPQGQAPVRRPAPQGNKPRNFDN